MYEYFVGQSPGRTYWAQSQRLCTAEISTSITSNDRVLRRLRNRLPSAQLLEILLLADVFSLILLKITYTNNPFINF